MRESEGSRTEDGLTWGVKQSSAAGVQGLEARRVDPFRPVKGMRRPLARIRGGGRPPALAHGRPASERLARPDRSTNIARSVVADLRLRPAGPAAGAIDVNQGDTRADQCMVPSVLVRPPGLGRP